MTIWKEKAIKQRYITETLFLKNVTVLFFFHFFIHLCTFDVNTVHVFLNCVHLSEKLC